MNKDILTIVYLIVNTDKGIILAGNINNINNHVN